MCEMKKSGAKQYREKKGEAPHLVKDKEWYSFDDAESARSKVQTSFNQYWLAGLAR